MIYMLRIQVIEVEEKDVTLSGDMKENVILSLDNVQHSAELGRVVSFAQKVYKFICKNAI